MNIKTSIKSLSENAKQFNKTITESPSPQYGQDGLRAKLGLLRALLDNPTLGDCGGQSFEQLSLVYTGLAWELRMTACQRSA